jgi:acyl carrier protein
VGQALSQEQMTAEILEFIREEYLEAGQRVDATTSLIRGGFVDSFSMASLRAHLEERYGVAIPDGRASAAAFDSVNSIVQLVESLRSGCE